MVQAVLDLPVAAGYGEQSLGAALGRVRRQAGQVVVVLDGCLVGQVDSLAGRAYVDDLAQAGLPSAAPLGAVAIGARREVDP